MISLLHSVLIVFCMQSPESATIRGMLVDVSGGALSGASVRVLESESHIVVAHVISNQAGTFEVGPLKPGTYDMTAWLPAFRLRLLSKLVVKDDAANDLGKLRLDVAGCDAPGVMCDTFTTEPPIPNILRAGILVVALNCGADLIRGKASCTVTSRDDFTVIKDGVGIYLKSTKRAAFRIPSNSGCTESSATGSHVRLDGLGPGMDLCIARRDGSVSHVFVVNEVETNSTEVKLQYTTTKLAK